MNLLHRAVRQHIGTQLRHRTILKLLRHINDRLRILNFINADLIFNPCINKLHGYASVFLLVFNYIRKVSRKSKALFLFRIDLNYFKNIKRISSAGILFDF